jgi:hypothetical protein
LHLDIHASIKPWSPFLKDAQNSLQYTYVNLGYLHPVPVDWYTGTLLLHCSQQIIFIFFLINQVFPTDLKPKLLAVNPSFDFTDTKEIPLIACLCKKICCKLLFQCCSQSIYNRSAINGISIVLGTSVGRQGL